MTATRRRSSLRALLSAVPSVALLILLLGAPLLALSNIGGHDAAVIEAPNSPKKGVGFVLLVSLQRA